MNVRHDLPIQPIQAPTQRGDLFTALIIGRRGAIEALRDRSTLLLGVFFAVVLPLFLVQTIVHPLVHDATLGTAMAALMLTVGIFNTNAALGIGSGVFAGEKEKGNLLPLLASPASNLAIFSGKILSAVLPALLFAILAEISYISELSIIIGFNKLSLMPVHLVVIALISVPTLALFNATIASIISSRVRTFTAAQTIGSFVSLPLLFGALALTGVTAYWGIWPLIATIVALVLVDAVLVVIGSATWRREEVLAKL